MAYRNNRVCDHLTLGVCHCTSNDDSWNIKKVLKQTDVGYCSRLLLGKKLAEEFVLPVLGAKAHRGIQVKIWDIDTKSMHTIKFKRRSGMYFFNGGWVKEFVIRRGLQEGNKIGLYWDQYGKFFNFTVLEADKDQNRHYV
ncbi:putative transcription factor B3-Domain family [Medicago truncatula]|uniref:E1 protein n=1 Tax=Medicago truncatula TaxID=3880 RepID=A0A072UG20_MEDTR|nr:putative B3 domain-containing protein At1g78640 [Medicago truncatula]KEH24730.1 E1 protein [Medicago truncatula]RHN49661.1 putative transcription factor B3-Domain family [Medicago truncatula]